MFVVVVTLSFHIYNFLDMNYDPQGEKGKLFP